jgi:hypothetical protein
MLLAVALCVPSTAQSSSPSPDPYPGSGGLFLGTPSQSKIDSGKFNFSKSRFASFKIGVTTKSEVVKALGAPAGWTTDADGKSQLEYDYVSPVDPMTAKFGMPMRRVMYTFFSFDASRVLTRITYPGYDSSKGT